MNLRAVVLAALASGVATPPSAAYGTVVGPLPHPQRQFYRSFLGKVPPELVASPNGWFNARRDLSLSMLRGQVVWLEFSFVN